MKDILVIHHSADLDGICSREVARKALGDSADYLGYDYGQPVPDISGYETVYLIDISLPIDVMRANAAKMVVIDHHKTLIEAVAPFKSEFKGHYCIDGVAACRLAWQYFERLKSDDRSLPPSKQDYVDRKVSEPYAVQLLGMYDIWDKSLPEVDLFQLGLQAERSPDWKKLFTLGRLTADSDGAITVGPVDLFYVDEIIRNGRVIQSYTEVTNAQISTERGFDVEFEGLTFRALNIARCNSLTFTAALRPEHDGCLGYFWNGKKWRFSFYGVPHKPDVDLSVIAKKYGGGGHRQSCGMELDNLPEIFGGNDAKG